MVRMSKQGKRRAIAKRRPKGPSPKTGPLKTNNYNKHENAVPQEKATNVFIPKID